MNLIVDENVDNLIADALRQNGYSVLVTQNSTQSMSVTKFSAFSQAWWSKKHKIFREVPSVQWKTKKI